MVLALVACDDVVVGGAGGQAGVVVGGVPVGVAIGGVRPAGGGAAQDLVAGRAGDGAQLRSISVVLAVAAVRPVGAGGGVGRRGRCIAR